MVRSMLGRLAASGIVERTGRRGLSRLRVAPRFLAHAERTADRLRFPERTDLLRTLQASLATWDGFDRDSHTAAAYLKDWMADRDQTGPLVGSMVGLDRFVAA